MDALLGDPHKLPDFAPLYGIVFQDVLDRHNVSHWGWFELDSLLGDLQPVIRLLPTYDIITFPHAVRTWVWSSIPS